MNESLPTPELNQPVAFAASQADMPIPTSSSASRRLGLVYLVLSVLFLLLAGQWWMTRSENDKLRQEIARRLQMGDSRGAEIKVLVRSVQDSNKELQGKVSVLESKQVEAQSQQLALEQLYKDLSRNSDEWALSEVEYVLSTASQQLQLAGNVQGALIALQNADKNLSRSDKPQFIIVRRAIAHDIEKLKALPMLDVAGIAVRLDSVISQIDSLPLLSDEKPVIGILSANKQASADSHFAKQVDDSVSPGDAISFWKNKLKKQWQSWSTAIGAEISQLIRVRSVANPDALLLSPTQAYYARENLKLRLLNARLGLLSRNESAFRSDLMGAQETIVKYFDTRAKQVQNSQIMLKQIQSSNLLINMPVLESFEAIRTYKGKP